MAILKADHVILNQEIDRLQVDLTTLRRRIIKKNKVILKLEEKIDSFKRKSARVRPKLSIDKKTGKKVAEPPPDMQVEIQGGYYKIGLHGKAYVHDNTEWILSSKSVEEIEAAIG